MDLRSHLVGVLLVEKILGLAVGVLEDFFHIVFSELLEFDRLALI